MKLKYFKWHVFIPIFLLFFSYVFGVAVELLGGAQLFVRAFVLVFCVASSLFMAISFNLRSCIFFIFFLIYASVLYSINGGVIVLNFVYLAVVLFYFYSLRVGRDDFLYYSLVSGFLVVFLYLVYLFVNGVSLEPVVLGGRARYYFGFTNPNKVGIVAYSFIVLSALYLFGRNNFLLFLICIPFVVVAVYSDSRTALYALVLFAGLACFPSLTRFRRLMFLIPIIFFIGSFYIATLNESDFLNLALSNRPIDFHDFISSLGAYDFIVGSSSDGYRVDNSYILAYFAIGPIGVLLFLCLLFRASCGVFSSLEFSFMVSIMAYGLMEGVLVRVEFPVVIYFYYLILGRDNAVSRVGGTA
ncbi:hypothetical protein [Pseudomonas sp. XK-1]|uniref:hypothetical protein n=1 Tax=Pseudomonas sp. XK-1 TaxID=3136019 RepID=UPI00311A1B4C